MGTWYEIQRSHGSPFQPDSFNCTTTAYSNLNAEAGTFDVYNSSTVKSLPRFGVHAKASVAGLPSGQAIVSFFGQSTGEPNYNVIDTDYETYAMIYNCVENDDSVPFFTIISRTPKMDHALFSTLTAKAETMLPNYDWSLVRITKQGEDCNYGSAKADSTL